MKTDGSPERQHPVTQQPNYRPRKPAAAQSTAPAAHFWDDISVQDQGRRGTFYQRPMYSLSFNGRKRFSFKLDSAEISLLGQQSNIKIRQ